MKKISIVIPTYNEQENVVPMTGAITGIMKKSLPEYDYEIIWHMLYNKISLTEKR